MVIVAKNYTVTVNNPTDEDSDLFDRFVKDEPLMQYCIRGHEVSSTGTPHWQIYLQLTSRKSINFIKKAYFPRAHIEVARGSAKQNFTYCSKDKNFDEFGEMITPGKRSDLDQIKEKLDEGSSILDIAQDHFRDFVRYHKAFQYYQSLTSSRSLRKVEVSLYYGEPGSGKTYKAFTENSDDCYILSQGNTGLWFDGYSGQSTLIIDDFNGWIKYSLLLRILDIYPLQVETKGSTTQARWTKVIITSNYLPPRWYAEQYDVEALWRRIPNVLYLREKYQPETLTVAEEIDGGSQFGDE